MTWSVARIVVGRGEEEEGYIGGRERLKIQKGKQVPLGRIRTH